MTRITATLLLLLSLLPACAPAGPVPPTDSPGPAFSIDGSVIRVDLEGGFYGLVDRQGNRYLPDRLPADFQVDGLAIRARLAPLPSAVGYRMWGRKVQLLAIERR